MEAVDKDGGGSQEVQERGADLVCEELRDIDCGGAGSAWWTCTCGQRGHGKCSTTRLEVVRGAAGLLEHQRGSNSRRAEGGAVEQAAAGSH